RPRREEVAMPDPAAAVSESSPGPHEFVLPPRHRLFAVFDDRRPTASRLSRRAGSSVGWFLVHALGAVERSTDAVAEA
ncbi:MAG: hypothetical protein ACP5P9_10225, partial [Acidimicrobiales bacterium]